MFELFRRGLERHWALATTDPPSDSPRWVVHGLEQHVSESGDGISNAEANVTVL